MLSGLAQDISDMDKAKIGLPVQGGNIVKDVFCGERSFKE